MFYGEIRTNQQISYISICSLSILYNSKLILMATYLGINAVVVTRDNCIANTLKQIPLLLKMDLSKVSDGRVHWALMGTFMHFMGKQLSFFVLLKKGLIL